MTGKNACKCYKSKPYISDVQANNRNYVEYIRVPRTLRSDFITIKKIIQQLKNSEFKSMSKYLVNKDVSST